MTGFFARQVLQQIIDTTTDCSWSKIDPSRNKSNWPKDGLPRLTTATSTKDIFAKAIAWFVVSRAHVERGSLDAEWNSLLAKVGVPRDWADQMALPQSPAEQRRFNVETRVAEFWYSIWGNPASDPLLRLAQLEANATDVRDPIELLAAAVPRIHTGRWATAPASLQLKLQVTNELSIQPLLDLAQAFETPFADELDIGVPMTPAQHSALRGLDVRLADHISDVRSARGGLTNDQRNALFNIYDYLRHRELLDLRQDELENADVLLIPGVRNTVYYRLDRALELLSSARQNPYVLLTGDQPSYELEKQTFTEAGAMASYMLRDHAGQRLDPDRVLLEERARSFRENAFLSLDALQGVCLERGRPLTVVLVTAPYALRRLYLIALAQWSGFPHVVGSTLIAHGRTNWSLGALQSDSTSNEYFTAGIARWMNEYLKLFGGRAVAEF